MLDNFYKVYMSRFLDALLHISIDLGFDPLHPQHPMLHEQYDIGHLEDLLHVHRVQGLQSALGDCAQFQEYKL